jgi:hypothetical protein
VLAGFVLVPAAIWVNVWAWHTWLGPLAERQAMNTMQERHQKVRVQVSSPTRLEPVAQALEQTLDSASWGFQVESKSRTDQGQTAQGEVNPRVELNAPVDLNAPVRRVGLVMKPGETPGEATRVMYRPGLAGIAKVVAARVAYVMYGQEPLVEEDRSQSLSGADILVDLHGSPRGFRDPLMPPPAAGPGTNLAAPGPKPLTDVRVAVIGCSIAEKDSKRIIASILPAIGRLGAKAEVRLVSESQRATFAPSDRGFNIRVTKGYPKEIAGAQALLKEPEFRSTGKWQQVFTRQQSRNYLSIFVCPVGFSAPRTLSKEPIRHPDNNRGQLPSSGPPVESTNPVQQSIDQPSVAPLQQQGPAAENPIASQKVKKLREASGQGDGVPPEVPENFQVR